MVEGQLCLRKVLFMTFYEFMTVLIITLIGIILLGIILFYCATCNLLQIENYIYNYVLSLC